MPEVHNSGINTLELSPFSTISCMEQNLIFFLQVLTFNFTYRHTSIRGKTSEEVIDLLSILF